MLSETFEAAAAGPYQNVIQTNVTFFNNCIILSSQELILGIFHSPFLT